MKVSELMMLLQGCNPDVPVSFVLGTGCFLDIEFVENRLESLGWGATIALYENKPDYEESQRFEVEVISSDYVFATTKYHDA